MQLPCAFLGLLLAVSSAYPADWPSWRGPAQNGVSEETSLVESWSPIWHAEFTGRSTPIVLDGRVFAIGRRGEGIAQEGVVAAFDAQDGSLLWEHAYNIFHTTIPFNRVGWASLAGDPETGYVYGHTVSGLFFCFDRDGKVVWSRSLTEEFGRISGYGGRVHTPVVDEDLVIISYLSSNWGSHTPGRHRYFAFDKRSGETVWIATPGGRPLDTTYSVPVVATINGVRLLIGGNADGSIYAMKIRTGEMRVGLQAQSSRHQLLGRRRQRQGVRGPQRGKPRQHRPRPRRLHRRQRPRRRYEHARKSGATTAFSPVILARSSTMAACTSSTTRPTSTHSTPPAAKYTGSTTSAPSARDRRCGPMADSTHQRSTAASPSSSLAATTPETLDLAEIAMPDGRPAELFGSPAVAYGRIYLSTEAGVYCLGDPEAQFQVAGTEANYPREQAPAGATPAHLQIIPAEVVAQPGSRVSFHARVFDAHGRLIGPVAAEWTLTGAVGQLDDNMLVLAGRTQRR